VLPFLSIHFYLFYCKYSFRQAESFLIDHSVCEFAAFILETVTVFQWIVGQLSQPDRLSHFFRKPSQPALGTRKEVISGEISKYTPVQLWTCRSFPRLNSPLEGE
jgi:hypothetical protein